MKKHSLNYEDIPQLSKFDKLYASRSGKVLKYLPYAPSNEQIPTLIDAYENRSADFRPLLADRIRAQYSAIDKSLPDEVVHKLSSTYYTVCTAHQLNLWTGPLYYIYKILATVALARDIELRHGVHVIPVMVLGDEDHDFDEVKSAHIFHKDFIWDRPGEGATGRMDLDGMSDLLNELEGTLGDSAQAVELMQLLRNSYTRERKYGPAMQHLLISLFDKYQLVVLSLDDPVLKAAFSPVIRRELTESMSYQAMQERLQKLNADDDLKVQAHARQTNLFIHRSDGRYRIERNDQGDYLIVDTDDTYSVDELLNLLDKRPQDFSPNVLMRPVYQQYILPNLAYIGGGGELAYWLQLAPVMAHESVPYPLLIRRPSIQIIDARTADKMLDKGLKARDLWQPIDSIISNFLHQHSDTELNILAEKENILEQLEAIKERAIAIDKTLGPAVEKEKSRWSKGLDQLESRLVRAEKSNKEQEVNQIRNIVSRQLPKGKLQERYDNFIPYYMKYGSYWMDELLSHIDPWSTEFMILIEES